MEMSGIGENLDGEIDGGRMLMLKQSKKLEG